MYVLCILVNDKCKDPVQQWTIQGHWKPAFLLFFWVLRVHAQYRSIWCAKAYETEFLNYFIQHNIYNRYQCIPCNCCFNFPLSLIDLSSNWYLFRRVLLFKMSFVPKFTIYRINTWLENGMIQLTINREWNFHGFWQKKNIFYDKLITCLQDKLCTLSYYFVYSM